MTIRTQLNAKRKKLSILMIISFVIFAVGFGFIEIHYSFKILAFFAFIGFIVEVFLLFNMQCPKCGGKIGCTWYSSAIDFSLSNQIKYCPFCGVELDSELEGKG